MFAWQHAKHIRVRVGVESHGWKVYKFVGTLFFASTADFFSQFTPAEDSDEVVIDFVRANVMDHLSA